MELHIELALLVECLKYEWSEVYFTGETVREDLDGTVTTTRSYVLIYEWYHYLVIWTRIEQLGPNQAFSDTHSWGDLKPIEVADYEHLREGRDKIDTLKNRDYLSELTRKVKRLDQKDALSKRPRCRKCGHKMVTHSEGDLDYFRCLKYPKCKGKRNLVLVT